MLDDILVELECPICTNYMSPPIRQCSTGHSLCEQCRKRLPMCPQCKGPFTDSRNITLEGLAVKLKYPCMNKTSGCEAQLAYNEREVHELNCPHKGVKCAMEKCGWFGNISDIAAHWASKKMTSKPYHTNNMCHTKMKSESFYVNIIEAYDNLFWFKCKLTKNKIYWAVQLIGPENDKEERFFYEIEIFKNNRKKKRIVLSDYCQSLQMENVQLFKDGGCISISTDMVDGFLTDEQVLDYHMRVNRTKDGVEVASGSGEEKINRKQRDRSKGPVKKEQKYKKNFTKKPPAKSTSKSDEFVLL